MARLRYQTTIQTIDAGGFLKSVPNATVTIFEPGTTTPLAQTIYAGNSGGTTVSNPMTAASDGSIVFYLATAQRVKVRSTGTGLGTTDLDLEPALHDPADLVTLTGAQTLTGKTLTSPVINSPTGDVVTLTGTQTLTNKTLTSPVISGMTLSGSIKRQEIGPQVFHLEAYAQAADLNPDGTFKIDVSCSTAINLWTTAMRAGTILGGSEGPYGWNRSRRGTLGSSVYLLSSPANMTKLVDAIIDTVGGAAIFYCGNSWTNAGAWDSGVSGSGTTVAATNAPMFDTAGCQNTRISDITVASCPLLGPLTTAPTVQPGAGWLVSGTETRAAGVFTSNANSNNLTFENCSAIGWFGRAPWVLQNTQIVTFEEGGAQQYTNASTSSVVYLGATPLASIDSPFYPNPGSPADGDERMAQIASVASDVTFRRFEAHDMVRSYAGTPDSQSSLLYTWRLDSAQNIKWYGGPQSSSGRAHIGLTTDCRGLTFEGVEFYDDGDGISGHTTGTRPSYMLYNDGLSSATPAQDVVFRNCRINTGVASAIIGGEDAAQYLGLKWDSNRITGTPTLISLTAGYASATDSALAGDSYINAQGLAIQVGSAGNGGIGPGVVIKNPSGPTVAGTDNSEKTISDGSKFLPANLTVVGGLMSGDGSVGTPAWRFSADTDNGAYRIGANNWALSAAGAKLLELKASALGSAVNFYAGNTLANSGTGTPGDINLPNTGTLKFFNNSATGWITALTKDTGDNLTFGSSSLASGVNVLAANTLTFGVSAGNPLEITSPGASQFVLKILNSAAVSATPTGGGYLYAEAGALKYRGSSGTATTLAPA